MIEREGIMKYILVLLVTIILFAVSLGIGEKYFKSKKSKAWYRLALFNMLFALLSLLYLYFLGFKWYMFIIIPFINCMVIYLSAKYLFIKVVFNRRYQDDD